MPGVAGSDVLDREQVGQGESQATASAEPVPPPAPTAQSEPPAQPEPPAQADAPAVAAPMVTPATDVDLGAPANDPTQTQPQTQPQAPPPTQAATPQPAPVFDDVSQLPNIADIRVGNKDSRSAEIKKIYACKPTVYAIYLAVDGPDCDVMVEYADNADEEKAQRQNLFTLAPAFAELNALLKGWKQPDPYRWKIAYALQLALDGDSQAGKDALLAIKADLLADRAAAGRLEYLGWAFGASIVMMVCLSFANWLFPFKDTSSDIWLAAKAGLVGSGFSIALAIRGRSVGLDMDRSDNIIDGVLRLGIGVVSAGVLLLLLASGVVPSVKVGDASISGGQMTWQMVLIVGFVAGFLERLVPDLLDKRGLPGSSTAPSGTASSAATAPAAASATSD